MKKYFVYIGFILFSTLSCANLHTKILIENMDMELKVDTTNNMLIMDIVFKNNSNDTLNLLWSDMKFLLNECNDSICLRSLFFKQDSSIIGFKNPKTIPNYDAVYRIIKINPKSVVEIKLNINEYYDIHPNDFNKVSFVYINKIKQYDGTNVYVGKKISSIEL